MKITPIIYTPKIDSPSHWSSIQNLTPLALQCTKWQILSHGSQRQDQDEPDQLYMYHTINTVEFTGCLNQSTQTLIRIEFEADLNTLKSSALQRSLLWAQPSTDHRPSLDQAVPMTHKEGRFYAIASTLVHQVKTFQTLKVNERYAQHT